MEMLIKNLDYFRSKPEELEKTTILLDHGYHPEIIREELEKVYPEIMTKIQFELSAKPSKAEKQAMGKTGFVPVKTRWVIQRSNSCFLNTLYQNSHSVEENFDKLNGKLL